VNLNQVTLPATDVERSIAFYRGMGFRLIVNSAPRYARFECPEGESTFSIEHSDAARHGAGVVVYFECSDLDAKVEQLIREGYIFEQLPRDQPWLWREALLQDPSSNLICLFSAGENRRFPPWRVQE
jgi:predicted enzyme related to lactoylglutathione lyase